MPDSYLQESWDSLKRIPKELSANLADLVKRYGPAAAEFGAGMLPGAGQAQAWQDYGEAGKQLQEGNYLGAAANYGQGAFNQAFDTLPYTAAMPTLAIASKSGRRAAKAGDRLVGPGGVDLTVPSRAVAEAGTQDTLQSLAARYEPLADARIAQRVPTVKGTDPLTGSTQDLRINTEAMRSDPVYWDKITGAQKTERVDPATGEALHEPLHNIIPYKVGTSRDPEERAGAAREVIMSNLDRIYQRQSPDVRERSGMWYPGGNRIAGELSQQMGVPKEAAAAGIAALSPQTEWFTNVAQARRLAETYGEDPIITKAMLDRFKEGGSPGLVKAAGILDPHTGRRFSELDSKEAGIAGVVHDFSRGDRRYQMLSPEGHQTGTQMTGKDVPQNLAWGNTGNLDKAVRSFRSGGDQQVISDAMGNEHKVRNFYNNIVAPSAKYDDYTSDTHNVAAGLLRPLAGKDWDVGVGLGIRGPSSGSSGAGGLYGMYADAGRELAQKYGVTPFQIQSPTWEGVRALFPQKAKTAANKQAVDDIWEQYRTGAIPLSTAQDRVFQYAEEKMGGDVNRTPWR